VLGATGVAMADVNGDSLLDNLRLQLRDISGDNKQNELFINQWRRDFYEQAEAFWP